MKSEVLIFRAIEEGVNMDPPILLLVFLFLYRKVGVVVGPEILAFFNSVIVAGYE